MKKDILCGESFSWDLLLWLKRKKGGKPRKLDLLTTLSDKFWTRALCGYEFLESAEHNSQCAETESAVVF